MPLQPRGRQPEQEAAQHREQHAIKPGEDRRMALLGQYAQRVGADADETGLSERQQPGQAGQQIDAEDREAEDQRGDHHVDPERAEASSGNAARTATAAISRTPPRHSRRPFRAPGRAGRRSASTPAGRTRSRSNRRSKCRPRRSSGSSRSAARRGSCRSHCRSRQE